MKHLDLFSGIGGFALAAKWAGIETVAFCEIDPFCHKVLRKHWPDVQIHRDIRKLDGGEYAGIDIITGGYPCQPFSVAGKRRGTEDNRHLWPEMLRVVQQARPDWVVCENVAGHITMGLDEVLADLDNEGYTSQAFVIPACGKNASHQRDRVWIVGNSDRAHAIGIGRPKGEDIYAEKREAAEGVEEWNNRLVELVPGAVTPRGDSYAGALRILDGIPNRVDRLRSIGNSVVPQVAYEILRAIVSV